MFHLRLLLNFKGIPDRCFVAFSCPFEPSYLQGRIPLDTCKLLSLSAFKGELKVIGLNRKGDIAVDVPCENKEI